MHVQTQIDLQDRKENLPRATDIGRLCACCRVNGGTKRCGGCKQTYYCSRECQTKHWPSHKTKCKEIKKKNNKKKASKQNEGNIYQSIAKNMFKQTSSITQRLTYEERIEKIFQIDQELNEENKVNDKYVYDLVSAEYKQMGGIEQFIRDHSEYMQRIDKDKEYLKYDGCCDVGGCLRLDREFREKKVYDKDKTKRFEIYQNCKDENGVIIQQLLDQMHLSRFHLIDLPMRVEIDDGAEEKQSQKRLTNISKLRKSLATKRANFNEMRKNTSRITAESQTHRQNIPNKFVTEIYEKDEDEEIKTDELNDNIDRYPQYWSGIRFYYHKHYKYNINRTELLYIHGTAPGEERGNIHISGEYRFCDWYIEPKYESMKQEVLQGNNSSLSSIEYINTYKKAQYKHKAIGPNVRGAFPLFAMVYNIKTGSAITMKHILSLLLYTNHTQLSAEFSRSFRKIKSGESDQSLKDRHSLYGNMAKYIKETVECFGTTLDESTIKQFYHGIAGEMLFQGFKTHFCAPTSTTLQYDTATTFATQNGSKNGIIITIKNDHSTNFFFNCISFSDYGYESEMLFISGYHQLEIIGVCCMSDNTQYDEWITTLMFFQLCFLDGDASSSAITERVKSQIKVLFDYGLKDCNNNNDDKQIIPKYVYKLFQNILQKTELIQINIGFLNNDIAYIDERGKQYGFKSLKSYYLNEDNQVKWNVIKSLFPSLKTIRIQSVKKTKNAKHGFKFSKSILLSDKVFEDILSYLSTIQQPLQSLLIHDPLNSDSEIEELIQKYKASYRKIHYMWHVVSSSNMETHYGNSRMVGVIPQNKQYF